MDKFLTTEVIYYPFLGRRENIAINLVPRMLNDEDWLLDIQPLTFASGPALAAQTIFSPTRG